MDTNEKRIIRCPFCQTRFYVWASLVSEKRKVRCSCCENSWFQDPDDLENSEEGETPLKRPSLSHVENNQKPAPLRPLRMNEALTNPPPPTLKSMDISDLESPPEKRRSLNFLPLIGFLIPFAFFIFGRDLLVSFFPPLSYFYKAIGLSLQSSLDGFEIRKTAWQKATEEGIPSIVVTGELANMSSKVKKAPAVRISTYGTIGCHPMDFAARIFGDEKAIGPDGTCLMDQWNISVSYDRLLPGQIVPFSTAHPYDERTDISKVRIDFVE